MRKGVAATILAASMMWGAAAQAAPDSLQDWNGLWNDMGLYLDNPGAQGAWDVLAQKNHVTPAEAKTAYTKKRSNDMAAMDISGNTIRIFPAAGSVGNDRDAMLKPVVEYEFKGTIETKKGNKTKTWSKFEAKDKNARYPRLMLLPVSRDEGPLVHFHYRYGKESFEELAAMKNWGPTMVADDSTDDAIAKYITK